jgi:nitroimidazol reductase NimA-like FMN-containing flavoprotein (pyridoxamine 5'-phosphate oxidase superfamily)
VSGSERLDRVRCIELLETVGIGRVAWADGGRVVVEPVNFVFSQDSVLFRTSEGDKLDAVRRGLPLAFEADDAEPALRVGWSVLVSGPAEVVSSGHTHGVDAPSAPTPWDQSTAKPFLVRIRVDSITGRQLPPRPGRVVRVTPNDNA